MNLAPTSSALSIVWIGENAPYDPLLLTPGTAAFGLRSSGLMKLLLSKARDGSVHDDRKILRGGGGSRAS